MNSVRTILGGPRQPQPLPLLRRPLRGPASVSVGAASVLLILLVWYFVTSQGLISPLSLPPPGDVLTVFRDFSVAPYLGATLWGHALESLTIVLGGWLVGGLVGLPLGILIGWSKLVRSTLNPIFQLVRPIPPLAWIPLAIVWFGLGAEARIFVVFLAAVVPWTINATAAIEGVDQILIQAARTLGLSSLGILVRVVIPTAVPTLIAGSRIALGNAWTTLIAAELLAAAKGLGFVVLNSARTLDTTIVLVSVATMGLIGAAFSLGLRVAQRRLAPWSEPS